MGACIVCARIKQELEPGWVVIGGRFGTKERCPDCRTTREQMDELHLELERRKDEMDELSRRLGI